jgi:hypothetical protein
MIASTTSHNANNTTGHIRRGLAAANAVEAALAQSTNAAREIDQLRNALAQAQASASTGTFDPNAFATALATAIATNTHGGNGKAAAPDKPTPFDGKTENYLPWKLAMDRYVQAMVSTRQLPTARLTFTIIQNNTTGDARTWMDNQQLDSFTANQQVTTARDGSTITPPHESIQAAAHMWSLMDPVYTDSTERERAAKALRKCFQNSTTSFREHLLHFDTLRIKAHYAKTDQTIIDALHQSLIPPLRTKFDNMVQTAQLVNPTYQLTYEVIEQQGQRLAASIAPLPGTNQTRLRGGQAPRGATGTNPRGSTQTNRSTDMVELPQRAAGTLPAACTHHPERNTCPSHLRGRLGPWDSAERIAKVSQLDEQGRCYACRGIKDRAKHNEYLGSAAPSRSPSRSMSPLTPLPSRSPTPGPSRANPAAATRSGRNRLIEEVVEEEFQDTSEEKDFH